MNQSSQSVLPGCLYVVATPIGNLEDMTFRAVRILKEVSLIAAEDTRHTRKLLSHYQIDTPLVSCHEHNEQARVPELIERLAAGDAVALVSDAGTPSISDPGYRLVKACVDEGLSVIPLPGASAVTAGLSVAGLPTDRFLFAGFPARKQGKRRNELESLKENPATLIFYESPRRVVRLIEEIIEVFGSRPAMLAREITKLHEEYLRGDLAGIISVLQNRDQVKGECALFVGGYEASGAEPEEELDDAIRLALKETDTKTSFLAKQLSKKFGLPKNTVYNRILEIQKQSDL